MIVNKTRHEKILAAKLRYREIHREQLQEENRQWRLQNRDKMRAYQKRYMRNHPFLNARYRHERRARRNNALGKFSEKEWEALQALCGNQCVRCGRIKCELTVDHILPLSKGGTNWIWNIQPLCRPCNNQKYVKCESFIGFIVRVSLT